MADQSHPSSNRYQPFVLIVVALAAGIVVDRYGWPCGDNSWVSASTTWLSISWILAAGFLAIWWVARRWHRERTAAFLMLIAIAFTAAAWHDLRWFAFSSDDIGRFATLDASPACLRATVLAAPEILPAPRPSPLRAIPGLDRSRVELHVTAIRDGTAWLAADGCCQLLVDGHLLGIHAGDELNIFGQLGRPLPPMNPGEFDFAAHVRTDGRLASLRCESPDCVTVLGQSPWQFTQRGLDALRASGQSSLRRFVGPRQAGLAAAVLLGSREGLPTEEIMPFFITGTVHLLVVSGLNVAILAVGLYAALRMGWLGRRTSLALVVTVVLAYTLLVGAEPPIVRAAALVVIVCLGAWTGRRGVAFNSLAASAFVVLAMNPSELFQAGTQLSFLCVAVLIWIGELAVSWQRRQADPLTTLIEASRSWIERLLRSCVRWCGWLIVTTTAIWLVTLPLVLYNFHVCTQVTVPIGPMVWIVSLIAMWSGFVTLVAGWVGWLFSPLAWVSGRICAGSLTALVEIVNRAQDLPRGHFWAPGPPLWWVIGFYLGLLAVMIWGRAIASPRWQLAALAVWILAGVAPPLVRAALPRDDLRCSFAAMGHGACVLLETPDGRTILYDAGSLGPPEYATQAAAALLWSRGLMRIDAIVLSHADVDHYNAVPGLLERFRVGEIYVSPMMFDAYGATGPATGPETLRRAIEAAGVPIRQIWSGDRLRVGNDVTLEVLHPPREGVIGSDNANSITLTAEYAGRRVLLPGDLESPGLEDLIAEEPFDCDVLLAPHHGSRRSDPPGFAAWCSPEWVVISGGHDADPLVAQTYENAGAVVLNTGDLGAVEISLGRDATQISTWIRPNSRRGSLATDE